MGFQQFRELHPNVKLRLLMQFFGGVAHSMVLPLMSIYFAAKIGQSVTGVMLMFIFLGGAVGTMVGGSYADRFGRKKVMIVSEAVVVGSYLLITAFNSPFLDAPYLTFGAFVINVLFGSMFGPASQAMLIDVTAPANRKFVFTL
ncbi:MAG TPA: MFS transporter, partial [Bacilli bacterium]|nr:MFS transporter [Bacilli bacterium]